MDFMDRNALDWLFSTAPQALAALVGLIFAGVAFILGAIDKEIAHDETRKEIYDEMKRDIHVNMKRLYWLAGFSIVFDLLLIVINPIEDGRRFSTQGTFDPYLLIAGFVILLNVVTLIYSLWFIIHVANPGFFDKTVSRLSESVNNGTVETKEFVMECIEMEKAMRDLPIFNNTEGRRPYMMTEMVKELQYRQLLDPQELDKLTSIIRLRNLIVHGSEIEHVETDIFNDVKSFTQKFKELKTSL